MEDSKLVYFLRRLSRKERQEFNHYVASPLFNERDTLRRLLEVIEAEFVRGKGKMTREEVYRAVHGDKPFKDGSLRTQLSHLFRLLRDFLAFTRFREETTLKERLLLQRLNDLNDHRYFPSLYQKAVKSLHKEQLNASDHFFELTVLEEEMDRHLFLRGKRQDRGLMLEAVTHVGYSFLVRAFRYQLRLLNLVDNVEEVPRPEFIEVAIDFLRQNQLSFPLVLQLYYRFLKAFSHPEQLTLFNEAREALDACHAELPALNVRELYLNALNFGARRLNGGDSDFLPQVFELYRQMLDLEILQVEGRLSPYHCKNIVTVALRMKKFTWVETFLKTWENKIYPDHMGNCYHYNRGMVHFFQGQWERGEKHFNQVLQNYQDIYYGLNSRGYLLQIYYETGQIESLESQMNAFRMFLQRTEELTVRRRRQYISFINHLRRLINCGPGDRERIEKLREDIVGKKTAGMGKGWLLAKLGEL